VGESFCPTDIVHRPCKALTSATSLTVVGRGGTAHEARLRTHFDAGTAPVFLCLPKTRSQRSRDGGRLGRRISPILCSTRAASRRPSGNLPADPQDNARHRAAAKRPRPTTAFRRQIRHSRSCALAGNSNGRSPSSFMTGVALLDRSLDTASTTESFDKSRLPSSRSVIRRSVSCNDVNKRAVPQPRPNSAVCGQFRTAYPPFPRQPLSRRA
jgi:hypothetical protein